MKTFTPYEKMSKKEKAALNKSKRVEWGFSPVTRTKQSAKIYNRKRNNTWTY